MRPFFVAVLVSFAGHAASHEPTSFDHSIGDIGFSIPDGFDIERIAGEPLIKWPIVADFDRDGNLVVAESGGVGTPIDAHNQKQLHKIIRLVDTDRDGSFDERIVVADQFAFPEGVLCVGDSILVAAPPQIWKLTDRDGDGVCEERSVWFDGGTVTYCANDLHGPYLGPDGWIYWCKGAFAKQSHMLVDGREIQSSASHIYRRKLDGGPIDMVVAGGMDNPVEVAFTSTGEPFFTSTYLVHPNNGKRDGIAHAVYGSLFGKDHSVIQDHIRTGDLMPVMTQLGAAAPSGLACLNRHDIVPFDSNGNDVLVAAQFNRQRVTAHRLIPMGSSFKTEDHDLLIADRIDFHPTDVVEDADGSLIVVDTGGWYDLCCPTSRVNQKTASGGIYRLSKRQESTTQTRQPVIWSTLTRNQNCELVLDSRPWVAREATLRLTDADIGKLRELAMIPRSSTASRLRCIGALTSLGSPAALNQIASFIDDPHVPVAIAAVRAISLHRDSRAVAKLVNLIDHDNLFLRRAAVEALGRAGDSDSILRLFSTDDEGDRHLAHSIAFALIALSRAHPELDLLQIASNDDEKRLALLAVSQIDNGSRLKPADVFALASSDDESLSNLAITVIAEHPAWAQELMPFLQTYWSDLNHHGDKLATLLSHWKYNPEIQDLIRDWIWSVSGIDDDPQRRIHETYLAEHFDKVSPPKLPAAWIEPLAHWLRSSEGRTKLALSIALSKVDADLATSEALIEAIGSLADQSAETGQKLRWLRCLPSGSGINDTTTESVMVDAFSNLDHSDHDVAKEAMRRVSLSASAARKVLDSLVSLPSLDLPIAIQAIKRLDDETLNLSLLKRLRELNSAKTLAPNYLTNAFKDSSPRVTSEAQETCEAIARPPVEIGDAVAVWQLKLVPGDPVKGLQIFHGTKAQCGACHTMGFVGGNVGPDLTRIGSSRTMEAILEAILYPSQRLEQNYRSTKILTIDGEVLNGLVKRRTTAVVELQISADETKTISTDEIEDERPSEISVMPTGLAEQLSIEELSDLMALLQAAK
ncbi:HEAT repeat domain-containing protein [Rubripirellula amarantea]|nr:HEAT repeat domain-containing protein [Rubripirellula amarantea]